MRLKSFPLFFFLSKSTTEKFWKECRRNYRQLCRLCESVDDTIATITLLCLSNNLYFICNKILKSIQWVGKRKSFLLNMKIIFVILFDIFFLFMFLFLFVYILYFLRKKPSLTHTLYFWYSLIFLLGRTFILALYAAEIHVESRKPLAIFRKVKRECWCPEVSKINKQTQNNKLRK